MNLAAIWEHLTSDDRGEIQESLDYWASDFVPKHLLAFKDIEAVKAVLNRDLSAMKSNVALKTTKAQLLSKINELERNMARPDAA